jgi:hypothetical protein
LRRTSRRPAAIRQEMLTVTFERVEASETPKGSRKSRPQHDRIEELGAKASCRCHVHRHACPLHPRRPTVGAVVVQSTSGTGSTGPAPVGMHRGSTWELWVSARAGWLGKAKSGGGDSSRRGERGHVAMATCIDSARVWLVKLRRFGSAEPNCAVPARSCPPPGGEGDCARYVPRGGRDCTPARGNGTFGAGECASVSAPAQPPAGRRQVKRPVPLSTLRHTTPAARP